MDDMHEMSHQVPRKKDTHYSFANALEFVVFLSIYKPEDTNVYWDNGKQYLDLYHTGFQLVEDGKYQEAYRVFEECLKCNPVGIDARFEMTTCLFQMQKASQALDELKALKPFLYSEELVAKFYRVNGFGYCEIKSYETAYACYAESLDYQESDKAHNELDYICSVTNKNYDYLQEKESRKRILQKNNLYVSNIELDQTITEFNNDVSQIKNTNEASKTKIIPSAPAGSYNSRTQESPNRQLDDYVEQLKTEYPKIDGAGYHVKTHTTTISLPKYCLRCMKKMDTAENIGTFQLCPDCKKWRENYKNQRSKKQNEMNLQAKKIAKQNIYMSLALAFISSLLLYSFAYYYLGNVFYSAVITIIGSIFLFSLLSSKKVAVRQLDPDMFDDPIHNGFVVTKKRENENEFIFSNGAYAHLFASFNDATVSKEDKYFIDDEKRKERLLASNKIIKPAGYYVLIGVVEIILIILLQNSNIHLATNPETISKISTTTTTQTANNTSSSSIVQQNYQSIMLDDLTPVKVRNGEIIIKPDYESLCSFTVKTTGSQNYYIILKYLNAPTKSYDKRKLLSSARSPYEDNISFYVVGGQTVSIKVPVGVYKLYYATGNQFYGNIQYCFGKDTIATTSDDLLAFYTDEQYTHGNTVTLYKVTNGNFDTTSISPGNLPI